MIANRVDAGAPAGVGSPPGERAAGEPGETMAGHRDSAATGWGIVVALSLAGCGLLIVAAASGGPAWGAYAFTAVAAAAIALYGASVFRFYRRLETELPAGEAADRALTGRLAGAFGELGAGDLVRATERAGGLPERVAAVFTAAAGALAVLAEQIQDSSIEVASAAGEVNGIASELASGSSQQAASVVEITAAMEELARTASQIADSAGLQAMLAERAEASGNAGSAAVDEAVDGVEEVQKRISGIANRADTLGTRSKEIYRVLDLITEIADETHILSLNAAIEGAAAGVEGRRFAVVAEEVRRLAHRSQESVDSVRALLDEFASSIRATIVATEEGSKEATRVLERARSAAAAISALRAAAGDTARVARQISLATQQQNAASDEVVLTLREVSQVVQRMTVGLKQLSGTADRLNRLGLTIQLLAQSFHLASPRSLKQLAEDWASRVGAVSGPPAERERVLEELLHQAPFVELAYFVDASGATAVLCFQGRVPEPQRARAARAREGDLRLRPWYRGVVRQGRTVITPPYESIPSGEACFTAAAPFAGPDGRLAGVLGIDVNVNAWTRI
ncbi:MAG TPA: methyl-accepting chemotaxis protein [Thermoanaerobaculia bacterium]|nr:methyl-accepting chemotaxis protein [Thermoanaerobaculia bacterium]